MIFDAHLHFFSRGVFKFYASQAGIGVDEAIQRLGIEAPPDDLAGRWVQELDRFGVRRAALFGSAPGEQEAIASAVAAYPDRFVGFQMLNPKQPGALEDIAAKKLRGVLLFPAMHQFYPDDVRPVYETARKHGLVVFIHVGYLRMAIREKLGLPGTFDERFGDPARVAKIAREFSDVNFILPHFGCGFLTALLDATRGLRNIYLDTSSSNEWMKRTPEFPDLATVFRTVLDSKTFGPDRILFGSDSTVFPRGWRKDVYEAQRAALQAYPADVREAIFYGNAERLLA